jgi:hypothetical protein
MQKARIMFTEKFMLNDGLLIDKDLFCDEEDDENIYYAFFDDSTVALYSSRSQFVMKINTDELERLIENGLVHVMP